MPWSKVKLNTGAEITNIGYGTWTMGNGEQARDQVEQAIDVGFRHIDTAQTYRNESETGQALRESGLPRTDIFVTTKYSGLKPSVEESLNDSLEFLGTGYVDLYLVHHPRVANGDIPGLWRKMESLHASGKTKAIGVSNFNVDNLKLLLKAAKVVPAVNQILLHPYVYEQQRPTIEYCHQKGIVIEAYSPLTPITHQPGGPLDSVLSSIGARTGATADQILLAWNKSKGSVVLTTSTKRSRLEGYLRAGDLVLSDKDIAAIDAAGAKGPPPPPRSSHVSTTPRSTDPGFMRRLAIIVCGLGIYACWIFAGRLYCACPRVQPFCGGSLLIMVLGAVFLGLLIQEIRDRGELAEESPV